MSLYPLTPDRLGFLTNYPARHFEQIKLRFVTEWLSRDARESLGNWFAAIVDKKFEDLVDLGYKDYQLVSRKFRENANDKKRMMER